MSELVVRPAMEVRIWGARGSVPAMSEQMIGYGGNTACVEVRRANGSVILDAGTGIRALGATLVPGGQHHVFFTHFHWDHIQGLPFFAPLYDATSAVHFHASVDAETLEETLSAQMLPPYFPVAFASTPATKFFSCADGRCTVHGMTIRPVPLCHPGGAHGYVVEGDGLKVVYATDHEHGDGPIDAGLLEAAMGADLLIYDAHYTPEEYASHAGWGHSTWTEGVRLAALAGVKRLLLFHHHPDHTDAEMDEIVPAARAVFAATDVAAEGLTIVL